MEAELSQEWWETWLLARQHRPKPEAPQAAPAPAWHATRGPRGRRQPIRYQVPPHQATARTPVQLTPDGRLIPAE